MTEDDYAAGQGFGPNIHGGPVYWSGPSYLYQMPEKDFLKAYHYSDGILHHETGPVAKATVRPGDGMPGGHSSLSANGAQAGIVWTTAPTTDATADPRAKGLLHAFDALTLEEIWHDPQPELFAKFNPPTIADGQVFRAAFAQYALPVIPPVDHTTQEVVAVSRAPGNQDLFVIGSDNKIWTNFWTAQDGWNPGGWFPLPCADWVTFDHNVQQLAVVSRAPGNIDVFVIGTNDKIWTTWWDDQGTAWGQPESNGHFFQLPCADWVTFDHTHQQLAVVSRAPGNIDVFVIGSDNTVWTTYWIGPGVGWNLDPNGEIDPNGHFGPIVAKFGPAPIYLGPGKIVVYGPIKRKATADTPASTPRPTIRQFVADHAHRGVLATPLRQEVRLTDGADGQRQDFMGTIRSRRQRVSDRRAADLPPRPTLDAPSVNVIASVFCSDHTGAHIVIGEIRTTYLDHGGPGGPLGYPVASETDTDDGGGRMSRFEHGEITWDANTGAQIRSRSTEAP